MEVHDGICHMGLADLFTFIPFFFLYINILFFQNWLSHGMGGRTRKHMQGIQRA